MDPGVPINDAFEGQALYGVEAKDGGPQCSASNDFCFLCRFERGSTDLGTPTDLYGGLVELINTLGEQRRELDHIVTVVYNHYEKYIRKYVKYTHEDTGVDISEPAWVRASIRRHLLYSSQFRSLFHITIEQMYHSIFTKQNQNMIDAATGHVDGVKLKEFNDTVKTFMAFQKAVASQGILRAPNGKGSLQ